MKTIDAYKQKIRQLISKEPVEDKVERMIHMFTFSYYDKEIMMFKISKGDQPILYDGDIYTRRGSHNDPEPIPRDEMFDFYDKFKLRASSYPYSQH